MPGRGTRFQPSEQWLASRGPTTIEALPRCYNYGFGLRFTRWALSLGPAGGASPYLLFEEHLPEVAGGDRSHGHQSFVEDLGREGRAFLPAVCLTQFDDCILSEMIGNGL